jgi:hypothetical protein
MQVKLHLVKLSYLTKLHRLNLATYIIKIELS